MSRILSADDLNDFITPVLPHFTVVSDLFLEPSVHKARRNKQIRSYWRCTFLRNPNIPISRNKANVDLERNQSRWPGRIL